MTAQIRASKSIAAAAKKEANQTIARQMVADQQSLEQFNLNTFLDRLNQLQPQKIEQVPIAELEWILAAFVLSWGQRLPLTSSTWPSAAERESMRQFSQIYFPFAIAPDFEGVSSLQVRTLALAWAAISLYVILVDYTIDRPHQTPAAIKLALGHVMLHAQRLLSQLFLPEHPFWQEFERCLSLMSCSMLDEHHLYGGHPRPFSFEEFKRIAYQKMALGQVNYISLALLNHSPEYVPVLKQCWDAVGLAAVIYDDVLDWREDYENSNYTYLLSQILFSDPFRADVDAGLLPEPAEIGAALFCTNVFESLYELAVQELQTVATQAQAIDCPALANLMSDLAGRTAGRSAELVDHKLTVLTSMKLGQSKLTVR